MKRNYQIIIGILILVVFIAGILIFLLSESQSSPIKNTITEKGTKLSLKNNNNQDWEHLDIVIQNATLKNGTKQSIYIEAWIEPGGTLILDLSNMLGYGNNPLPTGTNIRAITWGGLFNTTINNNTNNKSSNFQLSLLGWSNTLNSNNAPQSSILQQDMPIGQLPATVTQKTDIIETTEKVDAGEQKDIEILYAKISITVDKNGNLQIIFPVPPNLNQTATQII